MAATEEQYDQIIAHSRGNIDLLCSEAMKRFNCSQSIVLARYERKVL